MAKYIELEAAIAIIEEKQKELCPVGRYGRGYVYGSDREKYDAWDEIVDALENIPAADVAPVVHGRWISFLDGDHIMPERYYRCSRCGRVESRRQPYCHCGAKMDGGEANA